MELKRYWEIICKRRWLLIQVIIVVTGGALLLSLMAKPIYKITANVLIDTSDFQSAFLSQENISQLPRNLGTISYIESRNVIDTYITLATGSPVIGKAIKELDLRDKKGRPVESNNFIITTLQFPKLLFGAQKGVSIKRLKAAEVLEIAGYSTDRDEAAKIADAVTGAFSNFLADLWRKEAVSACKAIERKLIEIEISSHLADLWRQEKPAIGTPDKQQSQLKKQIEQDIPEQAVINEGDINLDNLVTSLIAEIAELEIEKKAISSKERIVPYSNQLFEKDAEVKSDNITYTAKIKVLSEQIDNKTKELLRIVKESKESIPLIGRLQTFAGIYDSLKSRLEYAKIAESMDINNIVTVHPATPSLNSRHDIYFPKKRLILVMSLFMGLIFGIFLCFLLEYLDDKIRTIKDVNEKLNQPILGVIKNKPDTTGVKQDSDFYGNFWNLKANIKMAIADKEHKILCITSAAKGEGKSTIVKYLSYTLVESGQKVLLVDLNLHRPYLHKMFNIANSPGFNDFAEGKKEIKDIIFPTDVQGLYLIPGGHISANPLKLIDSPVFLKMLRLLKADYDLIILDTPAIQDGSDVAVIASYSDNVILVVASGYNSEYCLKMALGSLQKIKGNMLGIVLNKEGFGCNNFPYIRLSEFLKIPYSSSPQDS